MEPTYDSREPETAATEKTASHGGNGTKGPDGSGTPRSWRQYIDQAMPIGAAGPAAEQEGAGVTPESSGQKTRSRSAWERRTRRLTRWARERGEKARSAPAACREGLSAAANLCREKLSGAVAAAREKLGPGVEKVRAAVAHHPISPLLYATLLAVVIGVAAFQGNYARAYVLEVNGQKVGLVSDADEANALLNRVELRAASLLGDDFDYEVSVTLSPVFAAHSDLTDAAEMEAALFEEVGAYMSAMTLSAADPANADAVEETFVTAWALSVDGEVMGYSPDLGELYRMLDEIAQPYLPENAIRYDFVEDVQIYPVELPLNTKFTNLESLQETLSALRVEEAVYTVKKGDTFNAIAYSLDMRPNDLSALNPDVIVDKLSIGQKLTIQQAVPRLSVLAVTDVTYEEVIPSPVEYIETADLYKGDTKVKTLGEDGLALINAHVTYLNNVEQGREVLESTTLVEATTTYTYTGTTPRPTTASKGYYIWPVKGTITSRFGSRYIFGRYDYHLGIDIYVPSGTSVKAADGGTVITAGWNGSYGNLVAIRHDNGTVTYYAHNSSILVKVGEKVYQGQVIAKSGATGNVTGHHCHFEIRVNGTCVNPLNYLK